MDTWACPSCDKENDTDGRCTRCGHGQAPEAD